MADIRINALATTAASTASDDFVAVDGSANGTRKLNAYSPTFGGNLTVSGTGTTGGVFTASSTGSSPAKIGTGFAGFAEFSHSSTFGVAGTYCLIQDSTGETYLNTASGKNLSLRVANSNALVLTGTGGTFAGNLTVSGTGTSSFAGSLQANGGASQSVNTPALRIGNDKILVWLDSSSTTTNAGFLWYDSSNILRIGAENGTRIQVTAATTTISNNLTVSGTGNSSVAGTLLVATTTNSSNGKIQLATHTTSAGGIGFGTDISLYRSGTRELTFLAASTPTFIFAGTAVGSTTTIKLGDGTNNDQGVIESNGGALVFKRNATTTLTLDSSQRSQFEGKVTINGANSVLVVKGANPTSSASSTIVDWASNARIISYGSTVGTAAGFNFVGLSSDGSVGGTRFTIDSAGDATFAGKITANGAGSTFKGTATNDSAAAGYVGEFVSSIVASGSAVSLTTNTITNVTSISLTAGDWDVFGAVDFVPEAATVRTRSIGGVSTTSASLPATYYRNTITLGTTDANAETYGGPTPVQRISISSTTTVYLVAFATFSAGTQTAHGYIQARRVR